MLPSPADIGKVWVISPSIPRDTRRSLRICPVFTRTGEIRLSFARRAVYRDRIYTDASRGVTLRRSGTTGKGSGPPRFPGRHAMGRAAGAPGGRTASAGAAVAVGTFIGNVMAYGFNLVLSRSLGPQGYAELGTLLSVFLIGTVPGLAVQAVNARRLAVAADGPPRRRADLARRLQARGWVVGLAVAALFALLSPAISTLLPSVTAGGVAWTGVSLAANTAFGGYLGMAQGTTRFILMTGLFLAAQGTRLAVGIVAGAAGASPSMVMAAQTGAWLLAALAGHWFLRDLVRAPEADEAVPATSRTPADAPATSWFEPAGSAPPGPAEAEEPVRRRSKTTHGYLSELLRACGGLGGILLLANLDVILAGRYLVDGNLGRYNTAALISRAAFFAPQFVALLAFPRFARPAERRRALHLALASTAAIGVVGVALTALGGDGLVRVAFGAKYADPVPGEFDLGTNAWMFALLGALLAMVNVALMDGVARRSHVVSMIVLADIVAETTAIVGFAHHTPVQIVGAATVCAAVTAAVSVSVALLVRAKPAAPAAAVPVADPLAADPVPQT